jgi:hypothetical protein
MFVKLLLVSDPNFAIISKQQISSSASRNFTNMYRECNVQKNYSYCFMVEASDHGYVLHTRRIHVTRTEYNMI